MRLLDAKEPWTVRCWHDIKMIFLNSHYSSSCVLPIHFVRGWARNTYNSEIAKRSFGIELDIYFSSVWIPTLDVLKHTVSSHTFSVGGNAAASCSVLLGYIESFALHSAPRTWKKHGRGRAGHTRLCCGVKWPNQRWIDSAASATSKGSQHSRSVPCSLKPYRFWVSCGKKNK